MHTHHSLRLLKHRATFPTTDFTLPFFYGKVLPFEEREMPCRLFVAHDQETDDDKDPIHVVGDNRPVGGGVLPPQDGIKDSPTAAAVEFWVAELGGH